MLIPGRGYNSEKYRFAFNGKESDNEWKGTTGAVYDYGFRIYDSRTGKFLSVDPLTREFPWNSTYAFAENDVIRAIDLEGAEKHIVLHMGYSWEGPMTEKLTLEDVGPGGYGTMHLYVFPDDGIIHETKFDKDIIDRIKDIRNDVNVDWDIVGNNKRMKIAFVIWGGDGGAEDEGWSADYKININGEAFNVLVNSSKRIPKIGLKGNKLTIKTQDNYKLNNNKPYKNYNKNRPGSPLPNEQLDKMTSGLKNINPNGNEINNKPTPSDDTSITIPVWKLSSVNQWGHKSYNAQSKDTVVKKEDVEKVKKAKSQPNF
jgi:RHS repeat-associated protein